MFKDQIVREVDLKDYFKELGIDEDEYFYHFADCESAFSILCDSIIHPFSMRSSQLKPKFFGRKKYVYLLDDYFTQPDLRIIGPLFNTYSCDSDFFTNFHKLEYVFAFRKDKLRVGMKQMPNYKCIWRHKGPIKLNEIDFIFLKKRFRFTS